MWLSAAHYQLVDTLPSLAMVLYTRDNYRRLINTESFPWTFLKCSCKKGKLKCLCSCLSIQKIGVSESMESICGDYLESMK